MAHKKIFTGPLPQKNIEYEWSDFNVSLVMDDPFIQPWNDVSNKAWMDLTEGGNSESLIFRVLHAYLPAHQTQGCR